MPDLLEVVLEDVRQEIMTATQAHGAMQSQHEAYAIILEELDEFWEEVKVNPMKLYPDAKDRRLIHMRKELIQIAAMGIRAVIDLNLGLLKKQV